MRSFLRAFVGMVLAGALSGAQMAAPRAEVDPRVWADTADGHSANFLVILRAQVDVAQVVAQAQQAPGLHGAAQRREQGIRTAVAGLRTQAEKSQPGALTQLGSLSAEAHPYWLVNLIAVRGGRAVVEAMAARTDVLEIRTDRAVPVALEAPAGEANSTNGIGWNVAQVGAPMLWAQGVTGAGIRVAVADTGVQWDHPALKAHYLGWNGTRAEHQYAWWDAIRDASIRGSNHNICGYALRVPCDDRGHGTHVIGTAVGSDGGSHQIGVAPGARWMACRNMDEGVGRASTYLACLQFFLAPTDLDGENPNADLHADVVSNSYTCPSSELCGPHDLQQAVVNLRAAGIFFSAAAGNEGPTCASIDAPPAVEAAAITVGATGTDDRIADFSSRGPVTVDGLQRRKPDLVAPGVGVYSSCPTDLYCTLSGTSMAAPNVAGVVALLWSAFPALRGDVAATQTLLQDSAVHQTSTQQCGGDAPMAVPNHVYGYGRVNAWQAYIWQADLKQMYLPWIVR